MTAAKKKAAQEEPKLVYGGGGPDIVLDEYLLECVNINPEDIEEEFIRIPGYLAYWNARYAHALKEHLRAKIDLDVMKAQLDPQIRIDLQDRGVKVTEAQVSSGIETHADIIAAREHLAETEATKNEMFGYLDAVRSKKEMLISLGAHLRAEMGGDPHIREEVRSKKIRG